MITMTANVMKSVKNIATGIMEEFFTIKKNKTIHHENNQYLKEMMNFYQKAPTSIDQYGFYYLNEEIMLPPMKEYDRSFVIHSALYYFDGDIIIIFKNNGNLNIIELDDLGFQEHNNNLVTSGAAMRDFVDNLFIDGESIAGLSYNKDNKQNKKIFFFAFYKKKEYMVTINQNTLELKQIFFLHPDNLSQDQDPQKANHTKVLNPETVDIIYLVSKPHKHGSCKTIYIHKEDRKFPKVFDFYFVLLRLNKNKNVKKVFLSSSDCSGGHGSHIKN